jgi:sugar phosphate isomerase/epimerase
MLGLSSLCLLKKPFDGALESLLTLTERYGVSVWELFDEYPHELSKHVDRIVEVKQSYNLRMVVHAPVFGVNIANPNRRLREKTIELLCESIRNAKLIGAEKYIVHPGSKTATSLFDPGLAWRLNVESACELQLYSKDVGVKLTFENMPISRFEVHLLTSTNEMRRFLKEVDVDVTFDVGHAGVVGEIDGFISLFKSRIVHVHLHENQGRLDAHLPVGSGNIDWVKVLRSLRDVNPTLAVENLTMRNAEKGLIKLRTLMHVI